jgi:hypothetical protein
MFQGRLSWFRSATKTGQFAIILGDEQPQDVPAGTFLIHQDIITYGPRTARIRMFASRTIISAGCAIPAATQLLELGH